jgi:hypothetical protein
MDSKKDGENETWAAMKLKQSRSGILMVYDLVFGGGASCGDALGLSDGDKAGRRKRYG